MLKLVKIAITGGVASGKTSVCRFFKELGAFVVDTDEIVHELLLSDTDLEQKIKRRFGAAVLKDGKLDRRAIAKVVFDNLELLQVLETLIHPLVRRRIQELYIEACKQENYTSFVVEVPLLFETGGEPFYDKIVTVITDEELARKRFQDKGFQNIEYDQRMKRQLSPHQKAMKSHYILQNKGSLVDLKQEVVALNQILQQPKE